MESLIKIYVIEEDLKDFLQLMKAAEDLPIEYPYKQSKSVRFFYSINNLNLERHHIFIEFLVPVGLALKMITFNSK